MKTKKLILALLLVSCILFTGCDPTEKERAKGQNIDIERMDGEVVSRGIKYFEGDRTPTQERKGQPYYCVTITYKNENGAKITEQFKDIPIEVFDALYVGKKLPTSPLLTLTHLTKMEGEIVDMQADLERLRFSIVIKNLEGIEVYNIDIKTYYTLLRVGTKLPVSAEGY